MLKLFLILLLRKRGVFRGLVSVMWLGEGVGWSISRRDLSIGTVIFPGKAPSLV